jgi:undecaprenyl diphosphate synthase
VSAGKRAIDVAHEPLADADDLLAQLRVDGGVPRHVAIIMDGNGRWARKRAMPRPFGHRSGMKAVRAVIEAAIEAGVEWLSLFAFSQENWQRPPSEIDALMSLLEEYVAREADSLRENGVRVRVFGERSRLIESAARAIERVERETAQNTRLSLNLFISYSARAELVRAAQQLARDVAAGVLSVDQVDEAAFAERLYTHDCPDPDLLIRTSGEQRISNFLLWQVAYAELFISPVYWPDFGRRELFDALVAFQRRDRRFGRVST